MNFLSFFTLVILLNACSKPSEIKIEEAKEVAKAYLTKGDCQAAKNALDEVGYQNEDSNYISLYASIYGCFAGYSEISFFANLGEISPTSLLNSFASFNSSNPANYDQEKFDHLYQGIQLLLQSNGAIPNTAEREAKFGVGKANDLSLQALYLIIYSLGKFFAYYGNVDELAFKGFGPQGNLCLADYEFDDNPGPGNLQDQLGIQDIWGCNNIDKGHPNLKASVDLSTRKNYLCQGVILFNNLFEILSNITLSESDSFGNLGEVEGTVDLLFQAAQQIEEQVNWGANAIDTIKTITSHQQCLEVSLGNLLRYYLLIFETNLFNQANP
jgi:hypothetical protein